MATSRQKIIGLVAVLATVGAFIYAFVDVPETIAYGKDLLNHLEETLLEAGIWGPIVIFFIYLVTTVFMLPLWGFHMTCGYVYGTFWAALLIATTQAICAGAAFSTSRYLVGPYIRETLQKRYGKKFTAIDKAVGEDGLRITLLLRLSPIIPFGMNNYLCGCTGMKLSDFVIGTWLGVLPGTTAYCNMGSMGKQVLDQGTTPLQKGVMALGLVAALAVIKLLSDLATNALKEAGIDGDEDTKKTK
mmetsp:Transcript_8322/g.10518  ORF Transcript_8322/g.10518 Transcript_8322/m.10518 type:complete len:245 (-) Transcript_8322:1226-1960(-)|eukprot:CAMPEP_0204873114 /NCGR_PEP_ID=MMETSP1348-20121228/39713_1 /ASSEMBLY_ACC=CAM_ASM_000700 /TAXON_ID=215587 /ORGANISM="Aplanochytrium stocchinoi, Strain GSBS06" /LENGTH=244 /DNA_ID=CAMNT_0052028275 /DNA_START=20 /DNA_END=754 /DNA_ORIENTATION=+